jgi:hypothetical protein
MDQLTVVIVTVSVGVGVVVALRMWLRERLRLGGQLADATVLEIIRVNSSGAGPPSGVEFASPPRSIWYARYRYTDSFGVEHEGKSGSLNYDPAPMLQGRRASIRFDPRRPGRSVWIG